ncbi:MAG TPA: glycosyltransferase family 4 protein, partial [Vicinamibacterales bacterium]|nr:glycosyltransferase family 4 protein [Vicinamibacterales bacterium]
SALWTGEPQNRDGLDMLVCVSDAVREIAPEYGDRAVVIRNAIDVELHRHAALMRPAVRAMLGISPDERVVTFCGRLSSDEKQTGVLYDVIAELEPRGITFVIGGFFSTWARNMGRVKDLEEAIAGRRVLMVHEYMPWDAAAFHSISDVYLSTSNSEGLSIALLEAMACCVPTVTTAAGGQAEAVVEGETGHVVPIGDVDAIVAAVKGLLNATPERRRDMGRFGRHVCAGKFHIADNAREHVMAYLEAINAH